MRTQPTSNAATEDGSAALSQLSLDFACRGCHNADGLGRTKSDEELIEAAVDYHARPTPVPEAAEEEIGESAP